MKHFAFSDRFCKVNFFDGEEAVACTLIIGDETDKKIAAVNAVIVEAEKGDICKKVAIMRPALETLIGKETLDKVLDKCETLDSFALLEIFYHITATYGDQKRKNLFGSLQR